MQILLSAGSYAQFMTVLLIFVGVLAVTAWVTKWMANYQKQQSAGSNVEVIETTRIASGKYVQILRVGETYMAIAVCKDTVTMLGEVPAEQLRLQQFSQESPTFKEWLERALKKDPGDQSGPKDIDG